MFATDCSNENHMYLTTKSKKKKKRTHNKQLNGSKLRNSIQFKYMGHAFTLHLSLPFIGSN